MVIVADLPVSFDQDGFLTDADRWDRELAREIAGGLGITALTQAHWSILCYLRVHYLTQGALPWEAHVCRDLGLDRNCLRRLFGGPLSAWKVAGLPNPGEEARTYLTSHEVPHASSGPR